MLPDRRQRHPRPTHLMRHELIDRPVLVVEDQRALAAMQAAMLRDRWGCEVHVADTLANTRALLESGTSYFAACSDLNLPDAPNGEVIDLLVAAGIPTIAVTAAFGSEMRQRMIDKGVVDYVLKSSINAYAYVCELVGFIRKNEFTKVLIVDDDPAVGLTLAKIVERFRMQVLYAGNGRAALPLARENHDIRLALVDYHMPEMDGIRLTCELRQMFTKEKLAIIGLSSSDDSLVAAEFLKNGANDFIAKPIAFEEVICRINQNLEMLNLVEANRIAAYQDYLTGLPNRRCFFANGADAIVDAVQHGCRTALAMIDIDHFKAINDCYGHDTGDEALCHIADALRAAFPGQLIARLGGEEFGVLFVDTGPATVRAAAERFRADLCASPAHIGEQEIGMSVSIGLADSESVGADLDMLLRAADVMLYSAKELGRNRVQP